MKKALVREIQDDLEEIQYDLEDIQCDIVDLNEETQDINLSLRSIVEAIQILFDEIGLNRLQSMYSKWALVLMKEGDDKFVVPFEKNKEGLDRVGLAAKGYIYHSTISNREFWYIQND